MDVVAFPKLGLEFHINRVAIPIKFLGDGIYWYGIIIALALVAGSWISVRETKRVGEKPENLFDFLIWALPLAIVGARAYYVLFNLKEYISDPIQIFNLRAGGLAVYGAVIAAALTLYVFCRVRKLKFLKYADICVPGMLTGQVIGRWGNFFNQEAYGYPTDLPWGMKVAAETQLVHPTFLYESLWNLVGLIFLLTAGRKRKFDGFNFSFYLIWYGLGRFWIEGLRADSLWLWEPYLRISQLVAAASFALGVILYIKLRKKVTI